MVMEENGVSDRRTHMRTLLKCLKSGTDAGKKKGDGRSSNVGYSKEKPSQ